MAKVLTIVLLVLIALLGWALWHSPVSQAVPLVQQALPTQVLAVPSVAYQPGPTATPKGIPVTRTRPAVVTLARIRAALNAEIVDAA